MSTPDIGQPGPWMKLISVDAAEGGFLDLLIRQSGGNCVDHVKKISKRFLLGFVRVAHFCKA